MKKATVVVLNLSKNVNMTITSMHSQKFGKHT